MVERTGCVQGRHVDVSPDDAAARLQFRLAQAGRDAHVLVASAGDRQLAPTTRLLYRQTVAEERMTHDQCRHSPTVNAPRMLAIKSNLHALCVENG